MYQMAIHGTSYSNDLPLKAVFSNLSNTSYARVFCKMIRIFNRFHSMDASQCWTRINIHLIHFVQRKSNFITFLYITSQCLLSTGRSLTEYLAFVMLYLYYLFLYLYLVSITYEKECYCAI